MRVQVSDMDFSRRLKGNIHSEWNQISNPTRKLSSVILMRVQTQKYCVSRAYPLHAQYRPTKAHSITVAMYLPPSLLRNPGFTPGLAYQRLHRGGLGVLKPPLISPGSSLITACNPYSHHCTHMVTVCTIQRKLKLTVSDNLGKV